MQAWVRSCQGMAGGGRDISKAYAKGQARRASVRDTRPNEMVVTKRATDKKSRNKKKEKKKVRFLFLLFFCKTNLHFNSNFRPFSEGSRAQPLDHRKNPIPSFFGTIGLIRQYEPEKRYSLLAKTTFLGYYSGYYGITGVIPCLGSQFWRTDGLRTEIFQMIDLNVPRSASGGFSLTRNINRGKKERTYWSKAFVVSGFDHMQNFQKDSGRSTKR
jgi:hypothetical protein